MFDGVEWEKELGKDINLLRQELGITLPELPFKAWKAEGRRLKAEAKAQTANV